MGKVICTKCNISKDIKEFYFRKDFGKYRNECKLCFNNAKKPIYQKNKVKIKNRQNFLHNKCPWKRTLHNIKQRCNNIKHPKYLRYGKRGIKCLITEEELKELWFRDKAWLLKKPSVDREDNDGHYKFENCRYIEHEENTKRSNDLQERKILQFDLNGIFIREWKSISKASRELKLYVGNIIKCLKHRRKTTGGFKWQYKNQK